jgi:hypothetical protein
VNHYNWYQSLNFIWEVIVIPRAYLFHDAIIVVTQEVYDCAMAEIYTKIEELRTDTVNNFAKERDQLEIRLRAEVDLARA